MARVLLLPWRSVRRVSTKDEVGDIVLTDVAGTLEAVNGKEVHAELDGGLGASLRVDSPMARVLLLPWRSVRKVSTWVLAL
jgi:hypothetical protein